MKAIVNGKIILKDRIVENSALLYSDVVEGIVSEENIPNDAEIIDAKGGYISPGFIDLHIHGYLGKDVCDGEEESIRTISKGIIENGGGSVDNVDVWGKRKLAYEINKVNEGFYTLVNFTASPELPKELDRVLRITDGIMRHIIVAE